MDWQGARGIPVVGAPARSQRAAPKGRGAAPRDVSLPSRLTAHGDDVFLFRAPAPDGTARPSTFGASSQTYPCAVVRSWTRKCTRRRRAPPATATPHTRREVNVIIIASRARRFALAVQCRALGALLRARRGGQKATAVAVAWCTQLPMSQTRSAAGAWEASGFGTQSAPLCSSVGVKGVDQLMGVARIHRVSVGYGCSRAEGCVCQSAQCARSGYG